MTTGTLKPIGQVIARRERHWVGDGFAVRTKLDEDVREMELARTPPHELKFAHLLGRLRWDGESMVPLEPKRKGSEPISSRAILKVPLD